MPFIDGRRHRRPLHPQHGVDEPRTVEVVRSTAEEANLLLRTRQWWRRGRTLPLLGR